MKEDTPLEALEKLERARLEEEARVKERCSLLLDRCSDGSITYDQLLDELRILTSPARVVQRHLPLRPEKDNEGAKRD